MSKSKNLSKSKKTIKTDFFTPWAKLAFIKLKQAFFKASILYYHNPERHIQIETNVLGYAISGIFSQLTLDNSGQWHPVIFFLRKIILTETKYETHNVELLVIVETFKT